MFCQNCGSEIMDGSKFCSKCGKSMEAIEVPAKMPDEEIIDLSGKTDATLPQEGKYKPILTAAIIFCVSLIVYAMCGALFYNYVMERSSDMVFMAMLFVSIPFALISLPFLFAAKKKAAGTERKAGKKETVLLYIMTWLTLSFAIIMGFAGVFTRIGLTNMFSKIFFVFFAVFFIIMCNAFSNQSGAEVYYSMFKAITSGFLIAAPLGWILGNLMKMFELGLIVVLIGFVAFFVMGGRMIFVRYE